MIEADAAIRSSGVIEYVTTVSASGACHFHLRMLRMQKEGKWEEDLLEWHEEDEMWEMREEGGGGGL